MEKTTYDFKEEDKTEHENTDIQEVLVKLPNVKNALNNMRVLLCTIENMKIKAKYKKEQQNMIERNKGQSGFSSEYGWQARLGNLAPMRNQSREYDVQVAFKGMDISDTDSNVFKKIGTIGKESEELKNRMMDELHSHRWWPIGNLHGYNNTDARYAKLASIKFFCDIDSHFDEKYTCNAFEFRQSNTEPSDVSANAYDNYKKAQREGRGEKEQQLALNEVKDIQWQVYSKEGSRDDFRLAGGTATLLFRTTCFHFCPQLLEFSRFSVVPLDDDEDKDPDKDPDTEYKEQEEEESIIESGEEKKKYILIPPAVAENGERSIYHAEETNVFYDKWTKLMKGEHDNLDDLNSLTDWLNSFIDDKKKLDKIAIPIIVLDKGEPYEDIFKVTQWNKKIEKLTHFSYDDMCDRELADLLDIMFSYFFMEYSFGDNVEESSFYNDKNLSRFFRKYRKTCISMKEKMKSQLRDTTSLQSQVFNFAFPLHPNAFDKHAEVLELFSSSIANQWGNGENEPREYKAVYQCNMAKKGAKVAKDIVENIKPKAAGSLEGEATSHSRHSLPTTGYKQRLKGYSDARKERLLKLFNIIDSQEAATFDGYKIYLDKYGVEENEDAVWLEAENRMMAEEEEKREGAQPKGEQQQQDESHQRQQTSSQQEEVVSYDPEKQKKLEKIINSIKGVARSDNSELDNCKGKKFQIHGSDDSNLNNKTCIVVNRNKHLYKLQPLPTEEMEIPSRNITEIKEEYKLLQAWIIRDRRHREDEGTKFREWYKIISEIGKRIKDNSKDNSDGPEIVEELKKKLKCMERGKMEIIFETIEKNNKIICVGKRYTNPRLERSRRDRNPDQLAVMNECSFVGYAKTNEWIKYDNLQKLRDRVFLRRYKSMDIEEAYEADDNSRIAANSDWNCKQYIIEFDSRGNNDDLFCFRNYWPKVSERQGKTYYRANPMNIVEWEAPEAVSGTYQVLYDLIKRTKAWRIVYSLPFRPRQTSNTSLIPLQVYWDIHRKTEEERLFYDLISNVLEGLLDDFSKNYADNLENIIKKTEKSLKKEMLLICKKAGSDKIKSLVSKNADAKRAENKVVEKMRLIEKKAYDDAMGTLFNRTTMGPGYFDRKYNEYITSYLINTEKSKKSKLMMEMGKPYYDANIPPDRRATANDLKMKVHTRMEELVGPGPRMTKELEYYNKQAKEQVMEEEIAIVIERERELCYNAKPRDKKLFKEFFNKRFGGADVDSSALISTTFEKEKNKITRKKIIDDIISSVNQWIISTKRTLEKEAEIEKLVYIGLSEENKDKISKIRAYINEIDEFSMEPIRDEANIKLREFGENILIDNILEAEKAAKAERAEKLRLREVERLRVRRNIQRKKGALEKLRQEQELQREQEKAEWGGETDDVIFCLDDLKKVIKKKFSNRFPMLYFRRVMEIPNNTLLLAANDLLEKLEKMKQPKEKTKEETDIKTKMLEKIREFQQAIGDGDKKLKIKVLFSNIGTIILSTLSDEIAKIWLFYELYYAATQPGEFDKMINITESWLKKKINDLKDRINMSNSSTCEYLIQETSKNLNIKMAEEKLQREHQLVQEKRALKEWEEKNKNILGTYVLSPNYNLEYNRRFIWWKEPKGPPKEALLRETALNYYTIVFIPDEGTEPGYYYLCYNFIREPVPTGNLNKSAINYLRVKANSNYKPGDTQLKNLKNKWEVYIDDVLARKFNITSGWLVNEKIHCTFDDENIRNLELLY